MNLLRYLGLDYRSFDYNIVPCRNRNQCFKNQDNYNIQEFVVKKVKNQHV